MTRIRRLDWMWFAVTFLIALAALEPVR